MPHRIVAIATASALSAATVAAGSTVTGTWTAPFTEGHGEFVLAPPGLTAPALWGFRAES